MSVTERFVARTACFAYFVNWSLRSKQSSIVIFLFVFEYNGSLVEHKIN
ncbi:hypothetical protein SAMN05444274_104366 [Mariniphaga anaerophila]|uniref:Uncharacterized protein n=1 Tax=Mariniphaga anaerophila TaxID=1484053 RepID=A0A1M5AKJ1_9BACT|nr:hypothetical protein SAMN05444274_104366 [Mariniphaga anaerophila]